MMDYFDVNYAIKTEGYIDQKLFQYLKGPSGSDSSGTDINLSGQNISEISQNTVMKGAIFNHLNQTSRTKNSKDESNPELLPPSDGRRPINAERQAEIKTIVENFFNAYSPPVNNKSVESRTEPQRIGDVNIREINAAMVKNFFNSQDSTVTEKKFFNSYSTTTTPTDQMRSQPAVAGGTDITAPDGAMPVFSNVLGDMSLFEVSNKLVVVLLKAIRRAREMSAKMHSQAVESTERAGTKRVEAAKQSLTGAIASGTVNILGEAGASGFGMRALNKERKSIDTNVVSKNTIDYNMRRDRNAGADGNKMEGMANRDTQEALNMNRPESALNADRYKNEHDKIILNTQKVRLAVESAKQSTHVTANIIKGGFDVQAAAETKKAELASVDKETKQEAGNTHAQTANAANDAQKAIEQMFVNILSTNNSTSAAVAG